MVPERGGWVRTGLLLIVMLAVFLYGYTTFFLPQIQAWYNSRNATCLERQTQLIEQMCEKGGTNTVDKRTCADGVKMQYSCPVWF